MEKHEDIPRPALIMIRGLPGSGKSYLAGALEKSIGKEHILTLDPDTVDTTDEKYITFSDELTKEGVDKKLHPFRWSRKLACDAAIAGKVIIWSQPFTNRGIFERLVAFIQTHARERGINLPVLLVEIEIDHADAKQRIDERKQAGGHGPSGDTFAQRLNEYESYADNYPTVTVHGNDDTEASAAAIIKELNKLAT